MASLGKQPVAQRADFQAPTELARPPAPGSWNHPERSGRSLHGRYRRPVLHVPRSFRPCTEPLCLRLSWLCPRPEALDGRLRHRDPLHCPLRRSG